MFVRILAKASALAVRSRLAIQDVEGGKTGSGGDGKEAYSCYHLLNRLERFRRAGVVLRRLSHQLDSLPRRQTILVSLPARMLGFEVTDMRLKREERGPFCFREFLGSRAEEKRYECANGVR